MRTRLITVAIVAAAFAIRAPVAAKRVRLTPDGAAYFNVSRNLAAGEGFVSTLKLRYNLPEHPGPVEGPEHPELVEGAEGDIRHSALSDWPPAYPMFSAVIVKCGGGMIALQVVNALLVSICAGLVFLLGVRLFGMREGLIAGAAAVLAPNLFRAGIVPLSDALGLALALAALLTALAGFQARLWLAAGIVAGAAALTRYPNAVVATGLVVWATAHPKGRRCALACAIGFALTVGPVMLWQWLCTGSAPCRTQMLHYCVGSFREAIWSARTTIDPLYALHHPTQVAALSVRNTVVYASDLLIGPRGLFLFGLGFVAWALSRRKAVVREHKLVLGIAMLSFAVHAATWSVPAVKGSRFMLLSYCLLLPFGVAGLMRQTQRHFRLAAGAAVALTGIVYGWGCATASSFAGTDFALSKDQVRSIVDRLPPGTNVASDNPWVVNYSTGVPTAILPRDLDERSLVRYVRDLNIGQIVLLTRQPHTPTARAISRLMTLGQGPHGQNAYDGRWKIIPHIVQKLPTMHSPSMTPRKNGNARL